MARTGSLRIDNARFQRLLENVVWGQRSNLVDFPTDCPQRDERFGWTGDINVFCRTAAYLYDVRGILKNSLLMCAADRSRRANFRTLCPTCWVSGIPLLFGATRLPLSPIRCMKCTAIFASWRTITKQ